MSSLSKLEEPSPIDQRMLVALVRMQFGEPFGAWLESSIDTMKVERSMKTGKIKYLHGSNGIFLVLRPTDGFFTLTIDAAILLNELEANAMENGITILTEVASFIKDGRNVFAKHVVNPNPGIQPLQELYVCDEERNVLAVGKAIISGTEMATLSRGVAVKTRHGIDA
ncbi:hypothetical protein GF325_11060 [Candidatus Bathyarchaeota archaeon]|nr:hypothetical protein [Candidatus Bathyarchaeota archaeon]